MRKITMTATLTAMPKDERQSVIWFLILKNVLGGEIIMRICIVYSTGCYHKINCEPKICYNVFGFMEIILR